jgi:hypothetical protein
MTDAGTMTPEQKIRGDALYLAVHLEHELPSAIMLAPPKELAERVERAGLGGEFGVIPTEADADGQNQRNRLVADATVDRVVRHAQQFATWITDGTIPEWQRREELHRSITEMTP